MPSNPTLLQADWPQAPLLPLPPPGPSCITSLVARGLGIRGKICDKQPAGPTGPLQRSGRLCLQVEVLLLSSKTETQGGWGLRVLLGDLQKGDCQPPTPAQGVRSAAGTECQYPPDVEQSLVAKGRRGWESQGTQWPPPCCPCWPSPHPGAQHHFRRQLGALGAGAARGPSRRPTREFQGSSIGLQAGLKCAQAGGWPKTVGAGRLPQPPGRQGNEDSPGRTASHLRSNTVPRC